MGLESATQDPEELEICVLCKELTDVPRDTPIGKRVYWVEDSGQLHRQCYLDIYGPEQVKIESGMHDKRFNR